MSTEIEPFCTSDGQIEVYEHRRENKVDATNLQFAPNRQLRLAALGRANYRANVDDHGGFRVCPGWEMLRGDWTCRRVCLGPFGLKQIFYNANQCMRIGSPPAFNPIGFERPANWARC